MHILRNKNKKMFSLKLSKLIKTMYYANHTSLGWCELNPLKREQPGRTANFTLLQKM